MQGVFPASSTTPLTVPGGIAWNQVEICPQEVIPDPDGDLTNTDLPLVIPPMHKFRIGTQNVFHIKDDSHDPPIPLDSFITPALRLLNANYRMGVWKVTRQVQTLPAPPPDQLLAVPYPDNYLLSDVERSKGHALRNQERRFVYTFEAGQAEESPDTDRVSRIKHISWPLPGETFWVIGWRWLTERLKQAETADFEFALKIQGLQGGTQESVWADLNVQSCSQDRTNLVEKFINVFGQKFSDQMKGMQSRTPHDLIAQVVRMYESMCEKWSFFHVKQLAPRVEAAIEAMLVLFGKEITKIVGENLTMKQVGCIMRRDKVLAPTLATCLHYFMTKLEQDRGSRNANYKSMNNANMANVFAVNLLSKFIKEQRGRIAELVQAVAIEGIYFHWLTMDWADIAQQLRLGEVPYDNWRDDMALPARDRRRGGEGMDDDDDLGDGGGVAAAAGARVPPFLRT